MAANGLIAGIEAMLNGVVTRINNFIGGINAALAMLPEWEVGEGGDQIGLLDPFNLGRIDNLFEDGAFAAGIAAADAFGAAFNETHIEAPDLFGSLADEASAAAAEHLEGCAGIWGDNHSATEKLAGTAGSRRPHRRRWHRRAQ